MLLQSDPINVQFRGLSTLFAAGTDAKLHITELLTLPTDDVIEHSDPENPPGLHEARRAFPVFPARRWIAA